MKIAVYDTWNKKFTGPIIDHWEKLGHEVLFNGEYKLEVPADLAFWYQGDNAAQTGVIESNALKKYVQCVDIEVWAGQPQGIDWTKVDGLIFMAEHIRDMVLPNIAPPAKVTLIKPGIDLTKFTFRNRVNTEPIRRIAYVVGDNRIWDVKRFDIALMLLRDLLDTSPRIWQLHVRGTYSTHAQYNDYCEHLLDSLKLRDFVIWTDRVEDMNQWLDDKDFFLLPSTKEAFSYATGESMAKGIKPIIGNWRSADKNWEPFYSKTVGQMFTRFLDGDYQPEVYRKFIEDNYDQNRYFKQLDEFLEVK